jgi:peptide/nickel transport system permease protein
MTLTADDGTALVARDGFLSTFWRDNSWWITRVLWLPVQLLLFSVLVFFLVALIPGDPVALSSGGFMSEADAEVRREQLGVNDPLPVQLVGFLGSLLRLDFGIGIVDGAPIIDQIAERLPSSLQLAILGMTGTFLLALALGLVATARPRSGIGVFARGFAGTAGVLPDFTLGVFGILLLYTTLHVAPAPLGLLSPQYGMPPPATGFPLLDALLAGEPEVFWSMVNHLWLPVLVLVACYTPIVLRVLLPAMSSTANASDLLFRVSVGNSRPTVYRALLRRSLPTSISAMANMAGLIIGGTIIVEKLFGLGGLGQFAIEGVLNADYHVVRGFLIIYAGICMVVFLVGDILIGLADPRRRADGLADD